MIRLGKSNEFFWANFMDIGIVSLQNTRIARKLELKELFRVFERSAISHSLSEAESSCDIKKIHKCLAMAGTDGIGRCRK